MAITLGIDLGTNSIGYGIIDAEKQKIITSGVRIFPEGVDPTTIGQGKKEESRNATRRNCRQLRRQYFRKKIRKIKLLEVLIENGMCPLDHAELMAWKHWDKIQKSDGRKYPTSEVFSAWLKLNPYELRKQAISEDLSALELGRVFYHLIQRRGFLSNRKGKEESTIYTGTETTTGIDDTRQKLVNTTLGAYLYDISHKKGEKYHPLQDVSGKALRVRARYTLRDMYIREFELIWQRQAPHLKLDNRQIKTYRNIGFEGTITNKRNQQQIDKIITRYGKENVSIQNKRIVITRTIDLKELLGGQITLQDGKVKYKSNESVLFWQRPLRSQKSLLSKCLFEGRQFYDLQNKKWIEAGPSPCLISHPEFEEFRAYQFINNLAYGKGERLTPTQREDVFRLMCTEKKDFTIKKIKERLKIYETFNYEEDVKIPVNKTIEQLRSLFDYECLKQHYQDIWHCFYFYEDNNMLFDKLKKDYGMKCDDAEKIKKIHLEEGYSNVSLKAIRNITPYLRKGYKYSTAVLLGGIRNAFGQRWSYFAPFDSATEIEHAVYRILKEDNAEGEAIEKIKTYLFSHNFGFTENDKAFKKLYHHSQPVVQKKRQRKLPATENLRNPIVQQGLNELRRLVNILLKEGENKYGKDFRFDSVHIELGRDLKNSKKKREEMTKNIREREKKNNVARQRLIEYGLRESQNNIQKYLLYDEIKEQAGVVCCPYTGRTINISNLLGRENSIQIEHMIPYSVSLDDSFANKTLCDTKFNREKGELTPFQFYEKNSSPQMWGVNSWEAVEERAFRLLPYIKAKRFVSKKKIGTEGFLERQLNDTRYMSRKAVELFSAICDDVQVFPGQLTAELRRLWGLNNILRSIPEINISNFELSIKGQTDCFIVLNSNGEPIQVERKYRTSPDREESEIVLAGIVEKNLFKTNGLSPLTTETSDGKYWIKAKIATPDAWYPLFALKPDSSDNQIVLKGRVEKSDFTCEQVRQKLPTVELSDGGYWGIIPVVKKTFTDERLPVNKKLSKNQVQLSGKVSEGVFRCYNYNCPTKEVDGNYWCLLDLNLEQIEFIKIKNKAPDFGKNQLLLEGDIDKQGVFHTESDMNFNMATTLESGKYYGVLNIASLDKDLIPVDNPEPQVQKNETLLEGNIWVDEHTGEIKFDPKKNRDDHRHHAIDALVIATSTRSLFQKLSTYHAQQEDKKRGLCSTEAFPEPWKCFSKEVQKSVGSILISHKRNTKTLCKISKSIQKNGQTINSVGFAVRGQLHKDSVYGKRLVPGATEKTYHIRKSISSLKDHKHLNKIVDSSIRKLLLEHLQNHCNIDISKEFKIPKDAFFKNGEYQVFLPNKHGDPVPIKKIRMKENLSNTVPLKNEINQHVNPDKNHHVLIYKDDINNLREEVVSFWTVIERQKQQQPIFQIPENGKEIVATLQINDMFILGLTDDEFETYSNEKEELSKYLYRVQKLSAMYYTFRYHLASTLNNNNEEYRIQSLGAWIRTNPIKVFIDEIGNIKRKK